MRLAVLALPLLLAACASAPTQSGFLSTYDGMTEREGAVRAAARQKRDPARLAEVRQVAVESTRLAQGGDWLTEAERTALLREIDAQLCFELSERYEIAATPGPGVARVRAAVTGVTPTGRAGSVASAAAGFFIPGPIGLRAPGALGALIAEAEMVAADGAQLAAIAWSRTATAIGTDDPSLSRIGDALQFAEPFADAAAEVMSPDDPPKRKIAEGADPCARYGARFRPEGWAAKFATGLYVPQMSGAKSEAKKTEAN